MFHKVVLILFVLSLTFTGVSQEITKIIVNKSQRRMYLMHDKEVVKKYRVSLGRNPKGHKHFEGDRKTPEGLYYIDGKNPKSAYHFIYKYVKIGTPIQINP